MLGLIAYFTGLPIPGLHRTYEEKTAEAEPLPAVEVVKGVPYTIEVPEDTRIALGIRKGGEDQSAVAEDPRKDPKKKQPLVLSGTTALDPSRLVRIRARFAPAEVVKLGTISDDPALSAGQSLRELGPGDPVKGGENGTVLAEFFSVDVGAKKNDLMDALVQLKLDEDILARALKKAEVVPEVFILNAQRNVEADRSAVARALNTLKTWGIPDEDIQAVYAEAERLSQAGARRADHSKDKLWARVVVKAPQSGTILERNISLNEIVVDPTVSLFQIADVSRMQVQANASEDDLPALLALPAAERRWTIRTVGNGPQEAANGNGSGKEEVLSGPVQEIGYIIDSNQHSAVLKGYIENPGSKLRAGQYVTATLLLPPPPDVVEIPTAALVDDGWQSVVFIQPDRSRPRYTLRRVEVVRRLEKSVYVRSRFPDGPPERTQQEKEQGLLPIQPLQPGERVLTVGLLELKKELEDQEANRDRK
jgi:cobalt-zinc-cadmium efflux system membrane fusion protein